ncbi:MAG TPA: FAD binding domain-containing protein [Thermoanaerobaculales bacterium]|nr:FAD binding domain-containing protein [Thermoanaerobaculales bacterium]
MGRPIRLLVNDREVELDVAAGVPALDVVRDRLGLKGTKHACREGDCGACLVLLGELEPSGRLRYRALTSCLLPIGEARGRHLVTVEGLAAADLGPVQRAIVDEGGSQCGFCTPGFVVAMTGLLLNTTRFDLDEALIALAGNLCRCTGYASIRRAVASLLDELRGCVAPAPDRIAALVGAGVLPPYFTEVAARLVALEPSPAELHADGPLVAGGTDLYVQRLSELEPAMPRLLLRELPPGIRADDGWVEMSATTTAEDLKRSPVLRQVLGGVERFIDLICSEPVRQRATIGGNIVNASPIGDMTIMLLALDAELVLARDGRRRQLPLRDFFRGYKAVDLGPGEIIEAVRFPASRGNGAFTFERVSKRRYLDIASVNSAAWLRLEGGRISQVFLSAGGVAPIPMRLTATEELLTGKRVTADVARLAADAARAEVTPISDVRGSADYKRLLLGQLVLAHLHALCGIDERTLLEALA